MKLLTVASVLLLIASPLFADAPATRPAAPDPNVKPSPELSPAQVVAAVLEALKHNDRPSADQGIKVTFRFASPDNKKATGPIDHFLDLVKNPLYQPLLNHTAAVAGEVRIDGDVAEQAVKVRAADGSTATYLFRLSKQPAGTYKGCWLTDGVIRLDPPASVPGEMV